MIGENMNELGNLIRQNALIKNNVLNDGVGDFGLINEKHDRILENNNQEPNQVNERNVNNKCYKIKIVIFIITLSIILVISIALVLFPIYFLRQKKVNEIKKPDKKSDEISDYTSDELTDDISKNYF